MQFQDLTGKKFHKLTVIKYLGQVRTGQSQWLCECDCQDKTKHIAIGSHLKTGNVKSCGCLAKGENRRKASLLHGGVGTPEYESFNAAKKRCNPERKEKFPDHAGRGIEFRFDSFAEFLEEVGPRPEPKFDYSLDRIDNNGNYEKGNVKWATKKEQAWNRRCNRCEARNNVLELSRALAALAHMVLDNVPELV